MTPEDREKQAQMQALLTQVHTALVGNPEMGIKGLVERQKEDDEFKLEIGKDIESINGSLKKLHAQQGNSNAAQETLRQAQEDLVERIKEVERFKQMFITTFETLKGMKKRTIAILGGTVAFFSSVASFWDEIKEFIHKINFH